MNHRILIFTLLLSLGSILWCGNTYGQYRDPFAEKSKKKKNKGQKKKLFSKNKTKTLKKGEDPFKENSKNNKPKYGNDPYSSKKKKKKKIKEKDSFTNKEKNKLYNKKYSKKKKKSNDKKKTTRKKGGKKDNEVFILKRNKVRKFKEPDSFVNETKKEKLKTPDQEPGLFPKGVNPAGG